jgi:hypothetical protein
VPEASVGLLPVGAAGEPQKLDLHAADATPSPGFPVRTAGRDEGVRVDAAVLERNKAAAGIAL